MILKNKKDCFILISILISFMLISSTLFVIKYLYKQKPLYEKDNPSINIKILMYHSITDKFNDSAQIDKQSFENQIKEIKELGFNSVSMEDLVNYVEKGIDLPQKPICITFDDGYLSNYEIAYPILKKYDMKATMFIIGVSVGKNTYKGTNYQIVPHFDYIQAKEMTDSGLISIQSHTYDMHQSKVFEKGNNIRENILKLENETFKEYTNYLTKDYIKSRSLIEKNLGTKVFALSYPCGMYDNNTEKILKQLGVKITLTTKNGDNNIVKGLPDSLYSLNRINMTKNVKIELLNQDIEKGE